jgi:glucose/arabinose dehydrogenase
MVTVHYIKLLLFFCILIIGNSVFIQNTLASESFLSSIKLPPDFSISIYADDVPNARSLELSPSGILFVGSRKKGRVYAVLDNDNDKKADEVITIAKGLNMPNGVAFKDGDLYVAEIHRIIKFTAIEKRLRNPGKPIVVFDRLPSKKHHGWKFIKFGPDNKLYIPVGAPCNVCQSTNTIFGTITRINQDGSDFEIFAKGVQRTLVY